MFEIDSHRILKNGDIICIHQCDDLKECVYYFEFKSKPFILKTISYDKLIMAQGEEEKYNNIKNTNKKLKRNLQINKILKNEKRE